MKLYIERFPLPVFRRRLFAASAFALCSSYAMAVDPFTVRDIRVEGIQRTEAGTVFSYLPVKVGDTFTDEKSIAAIKALYATGFFKDVRIEVDGNVLVIVVEERPAIAKVEFTGAEEFEKDILAKSLKEIGIAEARIFDKSVVDRAEQELKRQYLSRGLYGAQITTTVTPVERNRVNVNFVIDEGDISRIKQINIVGNKAFSDKQLSNTFKLTTHGWFSWYSKSDQYSKPKLTADIESLKSFYLDRGYIEMQVESTQVSITSDKKEIYITININEGEKYTVSDLKFEGEMLGREDELKALMQLKKGDVYSGEKLAESTTKISERMGNFGYAFANVNANPEIDREKKQVAFTVFVDPGKRVYVRRMNVAGNTKTRDEVVRREFRQLEGSWYDGEKIKRSRDRVDRMGYFKEVTVETPEVQGTSDQVDVNMTVEEKQTGNIMAGIGYQPGQGALLSASVQQDNFAGSGNSVGVEVNTSKQNKTYAFSYMNPYFTDDGVSRSFEIYKRTSTPSSINVGTYRIGTVGAKVNFGVPFTELDTVFLGVGVDQTKMDASAFSPLLYQRYVADVKGIPYSAADNPVLKGNTVNGVFEEVVYSAKTTSFPLTAAWQRDSRDRILAPTSGRYQRVNLELDLAGTLKYYRAVYQAQYYEPLFRTFTLALNGEINYGHGLGGKSLPVFKNVYAGGIGSVRGFKPSSLGRLDLNGDALGGAARLIGNAEIQYVPPGSGKDRSLLGFAFFDAGNVYSEGEKLRISELRYSAGIGFSWTSPMGPMRFSYAYPLNAKPNDKKEQFQFTVGSGF